MHPLCCILAQSPQTRNQSLEPRMKLSRTCSAGMRPDDNAGGFESCSDSRRFAGVLYKWTHYGKGWRCRWFQLQGDVISYSNNLQSDAFVVGKDVRFIGNVFSGCSIRQKHQKNVGVVHRQVMKNVWCKFLTRHESNMKVTGLGLV
ncbi:putative oxysterol-binding protein [Helianthus anomalus]